MELLGFAFNIGPICIGAMGCAVPTSLSCREVVHHEEEGQERVYMPR